MRVLLSVAVLYGVVSLLAFVAIWRDKRAAVAGRRRTPERVLHRLEWLGGWPGSWLAMRQFRHKTSKLSYRRHFWAVVAVHLGVWMLVGWRLVR